MGRRPKSIPPVEKEAEEVLYSIGDYLAVHESAQNDNFTIVRIREDIEGDSDQVQAFYFTRTTSNQFEGGMIGKLNANRVLMLVPVNELSFPPREPPAVVQC